jgi:hypothetical protein
MTADREKIMPLNEQQKETLRTHLPYELTMLDYAFMIAGAEAKTDDEKMQRLAAIDNFYLHARCLMEFYKNWFHTSKASAITFTKVEVNYAKFDDVWETINDQVAHIGWARGEHAEKLFDSANRTDLHNRLWSCLCLFQDNLTDEAAEIWQRRERETLCTTDNTIKGASNEIFSFLSESGALADIVSDKFTVIIRGESDVMISVPVSRPVSNS